jgi:hypothetical protein
VRRQRERRMHSRSGAFEPQPKGRSTMAPLIPLAAGIYIGGGVVLIILIILVIFLFLR